jgi:hypothetical protein
LKHVEGLNKHVIEEIVRQVGYLLELYEDARSESIFKKLIVSNIRIINNQVILSNVEDVVVA